MNKLKYIFVGFVFGIILIKAEVVSWYRIQEMFRFQSFQMYGIIGSAIVVGMASVFMIKRMKLKTIDGEPVNIPNKKFSKGNIYGGLIFGLGWAMTGACPGPLYALIGSGIPVVVIVLLSAVLGTFVYGILSEKLPE